jgi:hypothetical protein
VIGLLAGVTWRRYRPNSLPEPGDPRAA